MKLGIKMDNVVDICSVLIRSALSFPWVTKIPPA